MQQTTRALITLFMSSILKLCSFYAIIHAKLTVIINSSGCAPLFGWSSAPLCYHKGLNKGSFEKWGFWST